MRSSVRVPIGSLFDRPLLSLLIVVAFPWVVECPLRNDLRQREPDGPTIPAGQSSCSLGLSAILKHSRHETHQLALSSIVSGCQVGCYIQLYWLDCCAIPTVVDVSPLVEDAQALCVGVELEIPTVRIVPCLVTLQQAFQECHSRPQFPGKGRRSPANAMGLCRRIPVNLDRCPMRAIPPRLALPLRLLGTFRPLRLSDVSLAIVTREGGKFVLRPHTIPIAIWVLVASIFLLDLMTPADDVSVCFAYLIPIFVSLFETRPRPILYAWATTALSILGMLVQPPSYTSTVMMVLIAVVTQWVVAILVKLQQRRLTEANERAETQRRFVDILSHEVGTALTTVTGQAFRLTKLSEQLAPDDLRLRADKIRRAAERIQTIISRIQFASSLGDGTIPIGQGSTNLNTMLEQLTDQMKEEQQAGRIELKLCSQPRHVAGDEMLLRQIFENVIANGIKYSPSDAPIVVSIDENGSGARVIVADQGSGIAHDELGRVCDPYYRGSNSKGISGAGLGLYVVEKLVEAHHGRMLIESEMGGGTRVIIDFPQTGALAAA